MNLYDFLYIIKKMLFYYLLSKRDRERVKGRLLFKSFFRV